MELKRCKEITWLDLPRVESPGLALAWARSHLPGDDTNHFDLMQVHGLHEVTDTGGPWEWHNCAKDRLLEDIESGQVLLLHPIGILPLKPLFQREPGSQSMDEWHIAHTDFGLVPHFAAIALQSAQASRGLLAPPLLGRETAPEPTQPNKPEPAPPPAETHFIGLEYHYTDGDPVPDIPYRVTFADGTVREGRLDAMGTAHITGVPPGSATVEYEPEPLDPRIAELRAELKKALDGMVGEVRERAKILNAQLEKEGLLNKGLIYTGAFLTGIWETGRDTVVGLGELVMDAASGLASLHEAQIRFMGNLLSGDTDAIKKDLEEIAAAAGEDYERMKQAYEVLSLLKDDPETWEMLVEFPGEYFDAQARTEKVRLLGVVGFEVLVTVLTWGVGLAASALAKSRYLVRAQTYIKELVKLLKRKRHKSRHRVRRDKTHHKEVEKEDKFEEIEPRSTAQRIARLDLEGHAPIRHGGPNRVTDQQLEDRVMRGIDPASGTTFDAFNKFADGSPKPHKVGRHATAFASDEALLQADDFSRKSTQLQQNIATARANGDVFVDPVEIPLEDVFGSNYQSHVRGMTRMGSKNNPTGYIPTDFSGGTIKAIYRIDQDGSINLHTLYPNPKP